MTSAYVVETLVNVTTNNPSQDCTHPDDHASSLCKLREHCVAQFCYQTLFLSLGVVNATKATVPQSNPQEGERVWITVAYIVIFIFGFFGNACIIYIVATRTQMKTTFNFLIVNMAIGDLLVSLFIMPTEVSGTSD